MRSMTPHALSSCLPFALHVRKILQVVLKCMGKYYAANVTEDLLFLQSGPGTLQCYRDRAALRDTSTTRAADVDNMFIYTLSP